MDINAVADLPDMLKILSMQQKYHPMEDWLESLPPHHGDPIGDLAATVETDNPLWPTYLETWLVQVVEGVCGWRTRGPKDDIPYCLVLHGDQGIGKTQFFARLGGGFIKTEADIQLGSSPNAEDSQIRTLRWPVVELAELDGMTRRQDAADMKAFLSRPIDDLRRKYGKDSMVFPRMTSFCGTVNNLRFLVDPTGNRRYLVSTANNIDWEHNVDMDNVWAHALAIWKAYGFERLSADEQKEQTESLKDFTHIAPETEILEHHYEQHGNKTDSYMALPASKICRALGMGTGWQQTNAVRDWLEKNGKRWKKNGIKGRYLIPLTSSQQMNIGGGDSLKESDVKKFTSWGDK
jgi:predicted P-loop ATPase